MFFFVAQDSEHSVHTKKDWVGQPIALVGRLGRPDMCQVLLMRVNDPFCGVISLYAVRSSCSCCSASVTASVHHKDFGWEPGWCRLGKPADVRGHLCSFSLYFAVFLHAKYIVVCFYL